MKGRFIIAPSVGRQQKLADHFFIKIISKRMEYLVPLMLESSFLNF